MGEYQGTRDYHEGDDMDVLYMNPSWHDDKVVAQSVSIAPITERRVSAIFMKMYEESKSVFVRHIFTEQEVDMIIEALQEAKVRWDEGRVIGKS
jgi:hypothetical protein